jgi:hypothetical protein
LERAALNYLIVDRRESEEQIGCADMHIQHSLFHRGTYLDRLHVYFNPYAQVPFAPQFPWLKEVALNYFDVESGEHIQAHPDGALVSRQVYEITHQYTQFLLDRYGLIR